LVVPDPSSKAFRHLWQEYLLLLLLFLFLFLVPAPVARLFTIFAGAFSLVRLHACTALGADKHQTLVLLMVFLFLFYFIKFCFLSAFLPVQHLERTSTSFFF
jgi:hypothetical protein